MEILVENSFDMTKSLFLEGMALLSRDSFGKDAKKASLVFLLVWAITSILLMLIGGTIVQALIYLVIILLFCFWFNVMLPRQNAKKAWTALVNRCGTDMQRITRFYEDHLEIHTGGTVKAIPYTDILDIKQSKRLLVLACVNKMGVMVTRSGFTTGSAGDISALLRRAAEQAAEAQD